MKTKELILQSERNRKRLIEIIYKAKAGHIGGDLSCLNVLTALYFDVMNVDAGNPKDNLRDRFILSKGHCVEALYVTLESRGFMAKGILDTLGQYGSILSGHKQTVDRITVCDKYMQIKFKCGVTFARQYVE